MRHKEQRVLVLFDVQNMYYSAKHLYNTKVDFRAILNEAVSYRRLVRSIAYVIKTEIKEESNFHEALNNIGIEVKSKDLQIFQGGAKKGDWDVGIAMDAVRMVNKIDTLVLISGDGDFKDLLEYMKSHGCRTEVMALGRTSSKQLKECADLFIDLEENASKYLIGVKPNLNKQSFNNQKKQKKGYSNQNNNYQNKTHQKNQNFVNNNNNKINEEQKHNNSKDSLKKPINEQKTKNQLEAVSLNLKKTSSNFFELPKENKQIDEPDFDIYDSIDDITVKKEEKNNVINKTEQKKALTKKQATTKGTKKTQTQKETTKEESKKDDKKEKLGIAKRLKKLISS
jgi:uncharacterized LabA/DUF88 family protein